MSDIHTGIKGILDNTLPPRGYDLRNECKYWLGGSKSNLYPWKFIDWWFGQASVPSGSGWPGSQTSFDVVALSRNKIREMQMQEEYSLLMKSIMLIEIEYKHSFQEAIERLTKYGYWAGLRIIILSSELHTVYNNQGMYEGLKNAPKLHFFEVMNDQITSDLGFDDKGLEAMVKRHKDVILGP